jgi:hypothetical protein
MSASDNAPARPSASWSRQAGMIARPSWKSADCWPAQPPRRVTAESGKALTLYPTGRACHHGRHCPNSFVWEGREASSTSGAADSLHHLHEFSHCLGEGAAWELTPGFLRRR